MNEKKLPLSEYFLRFFFPPKCVCCGMLLPINNSMELCADCKDGLPMMQKFQHTNPGGNSIEKVYCAFRYESGIRKAIHDLKFNDKPGNAAKLIDLSYLQFERIFAGETSSFMSLPICDIIICIPMHPIRKRKRGYNQSELLADCLAKHMNMPVLKKVMVKSANTQAQSVLTKAGRFRNLIGAFSVKESSLIKGKKVLLVDDVMTTGNTLEQCGKALLEAGAIQVDAFVVAMRTKTSQV